MGKKEDKDAQFWIVVAVVLVIIVANVLYYNRDSPSMTCWKFGPFFDEMACVASGHTPH